MLSEKQLEDIICKYPELLEHGLIFKGRQIYLFGKIMDILFEDKFGQKLIVELKKGTILRKHIGQIMEYEGSVLSEEDPTARVMLVGNRVPPSLAKALDHHGIEYKEISISKLKDFLKKKNDKEYIQLLGEEYEEEVLKTKAQQALDQQDRECSIEAFLKKVENPPVLKRINYLRSKIKGLGSNIREYARRWQWIMYKSPKGQFCGINIYKNHFIVFIKLARDKFKPGQFEISKLKDTDYVKIKIQLDTDLDLVMQYIKQAYQAH